MGHSDLIERQTLPAGESNGTSERIARAPITGIPRSEDFLYEGDMPATALDLVRLVGLEAALGLIQELGGVPFPVPKGVNNNTAGSARFERLAEIVGQDGALRIVAEYGDDVLNIPTCKQAFAKAKKRAMAAYFDQGATLEEVAVAFRVTTRWVSIAMKTIPPPQGQRVGL